MADDRQIEKCVARLTWRIMRHILQVDYLTNDKTAEQFENASLDNEIDDYVAFVNHESQIEKSCQDLVDIWSSEIVEVNCRSFVYQQLKLIFPE